jgi:hypothetical protein
MRDDNDGPTLVVLTSSPPVDHDIVSMVREAMDDLRGRNSSADEDDRFDDLVRGSRAAGGR